MVQIKKTKNFIKWFDKQAKAIQDRVILRLLRISEGNFGDCHSVGSYVSELRIDYGAGYRIYFTKKGDEIVILLAGGTKQRQSDDIKKAQELAKEWR